MRAAVLAGVGQVRIEDRPEPTAPPGWVGGWSSASSPVRVAVRQRQPPYDGRIDTPFPRVPGHDFAGRVDSVGDGVDVGLIGAPIAVKPSLLCGECADCAAGKLAGCERKKLIGLWSDGCLTEKVAVRR